MTVKRSVSSDRARAEALLCGLRKQQFNLRLKDGKLLVSPLSRLTPTQSQAIKAARDDIVALLEWEAAPEPADDDDLRAMWERKNAADREQEELAEVTEQLRWCQAWLEKETLPPGPVVVASWQVIENVPAWKAYQLGSIERWLEEPKTDSLPARIRYGRVICEMIERVKAVLQDHPV